MCPVRVLIAGMVDATIRCGGVRPEPCEPVVQPVCHGDDLRSGWSYEQDPLVAARHGTIHECYHLTAMAVYRSVHGESDCNSALLGLALLTVSASAFHQCV